MTAGYEIQAELRMEITALAHELVRLEMWAKEAHLRRNYPRVGELHEQRKQVRERRSALMRQIWQPRRRRPRPW